MGTIVEIVIGHWEVPFEVIQASNLPIETTALAILAFESHVLEAGSDRIERIRQVKCYRTDSSLVNSD